MSSSSPYSVKIQCELTVHSPLSIGATESNLPQEVKLGIATQMESVAQDPFGVGRTPPCPPHSPIGLFHEFSVTHEKKVYKFWMRYLADEGRGQISVVEFNVLPPFLQAQ